MYTKLWFIQLQWECAIKMMTNKTIVTHVRTSLSCSVLASSIKFFLALDILSSYVEYSQYIYARRTKVYASIKNKKKKKV